jgi:hypothetical protein
MRVVVRKKASGRQRNTLSESKQGVKTEEGVCVRVCVCVCVCVCERGCAFGCGQAVESAELRAGL